MIAETFTIEGDEDGWVVTVGFDPDVDQLVEAMTSGKLTFTIRDDVGLEVGSRRVVNHFDEGRRAMVATPVDTAIAAGDVDGYDPADPKSDGYHDRMADLADL